MKYGRYLFSYHVEFYQEDFYDDTKCHLRQGHGVVYGDTFVDAMENLCRYYGDDRLEKVSLDCIDEACSAIELSLNEVNRLENKKNE